MISVKTASDKAAKCVSRRAYTENPTNTFLISLAFVHSQNEYLIHHIERYCKQNFIYSAYSLSRPIRLAERL